MIDKLFEKFMNTSEGDPDYIWNKGQFIYMLLTDDDFYQEWGENCCEELTDEERYNIWFNNNYETGMERYFDPNKLPDYENDYFEPTPKRKIKITKNMEIKKCVLEIFDLLCDFKGFDDWWYNLDDSITEEIEKEVEEIIKRRFEKIKKDGC